MKTVVGLEVEGGVLDLAADIVDEEHAYSVVGAEIGEDGGVLGINKLDIASAEEAGLAASAKGFSDPVEEGSGASFAALDIHTEVVKSGVGVDGEVHSAGVAAGESCVSVVGPLHGGSDSVAVTEVGVVAHTDFVAIVEDRTSGEGEEDGVEEFDGGAVTFEERKETPSDAEVNAHAGVSGVFAVENIPFFIGDHFEG